MHLLLASYNGGASSSSSPVPAASAAVASTGPDATVTLELGAESAPSTPDAEIARAVKRYDSYEPGLKYSENEEKPPRASRTFRDSTSRLQRSKTSNSPPPPLRRSSP